MPIGGYCPGVRELLETLLALSQPSSQIENQLASHRRPPC